MVKLEGAGHLSNLEQPQAFTRAIRDFIKAA
jgi:pimeloyl-ACP methyl ester carboxylesterase